MKVTEVKKMEKSEVSLKIEVRDESFEKAVDASFRKNVKKIKVPGFRPGKATRRQIEAIYGEGIFFEDAIQELYPVALDEAVKAKKLDVVELKDINVEAVDKGGFTFVAVVVVKPEAEVKEYKGIKAEKNVYTVTSGEVDAKLKAEQKKEERITAVDRAAKKGDVALIDFEGFLDGKAFNGGKGEDYELELGSGTFIPGFEDQLVGKSKGDDVDVNVTFPEDYQAEDLKGKAVVFKVKVKEVREKQLPEIDDEFVKDISEFDTLDEYKKDIRKKLKADKDATAESELENALLDALVEKTTVDIPDAMIEKQIDSIVRDFDGRLQMQGMKLDMYLKYTGMTMDAFRAGFKPEAEKQVKVRLALEKVVKLEKIKVTAKDLNDEYKKLSDMYKMDVDQLKPYIPEDELKTDIAVGKALDVIKANAVITEKKVSAAKPAAKKSSAKSADEKSTAKKTATAKSAEGKTTAKKPAAKKAAAKGTDTKTAAKKPATKATAKTTTKSAAKKPATKKATTKKSAEKADK